jgi:hypothetical protein
MYIQRPHWLDYDPVALAVLVIGIGMIELLALMFEPTAAHGKARQSNHTIENLDVTEPIAY